MTEDDYQRQMLKYQELHLEESKKMRKAVVMYLQWKVRISAGAMRQAGIAESAAAEQLANDMEWLKW